MARGARRRGRFASLALLAGPVLGGLTFLALPEVYADASGEPVAFGSAGRATAGLTVWMAVWWLTEALEVYATALLPLAVLPWVGATSMRDAAAPYAHELIFLFLGGFLLALAMERWGLHRRVALLALRAAGDRPASIVGAFMAVTAALSMWVSNTATAVMMLPVATSVIALLETRERAAGSPGPAEAAEAPAPGRSDFAIALLLGIAYAASIGGIATPIGTPPNLFLLSYLRDSLAVEISFVRWMGVGVPLVAVFLPIAWLLLVRVLHPVGGAPIPGSRAMVRDSLHALGPLRPAERTTLGVFLVACTLWTTRPLLADVHVLGVAAFAGLTDTGIAVAAALALFVAPSRDSSQPRVLDWGTAQRLPWGILILFGGGLSLAAAIRANGVAELLGAQVAALAGVPSLFLVIGVVAMVVFLTELTSNTATTATLVPLLASLAPGLGLDPLLLAVPAALAASCAFMLPVATPPNAIVFGSGRIGVADMSRAGIWLNAVGIVVITVVTYGVAVPLLRGAG